PDGFACITVPQTNGSVVAGSREERTAWRKSTVIHRIAMPKRRGKRLARIRIPNARFPVDRSSGKPLAVGSPLPPKGVDVERDWQAQASARCCTPDLCLGVITHPRGEDAVA